MREVRALNTSASGGSFVRSTVIGPTCRHAMAKRDRSSAIPTVPFIPPVRAWERWQVTPGTFGSSKALTQILSFAPKMRNVVETQPISSAPRCPTTPPSSTTMTSPTPRSPRIPSPPHTHGQSLLQPTLRWHRSLVEVRRVERPHHSVCASELVMVKRSMGIVNLVHPYLAPDQFLSQLPRYCQRLDIAIRAGIACGLGWRRLTAWRAGISRCGVVH